MITVDPPMRIVVADDHALVRGGIGILIRSLHPDAEILECNSYEKTLAVLDKSAPIDLLLLDLMMPGMDLVVSIQHICRTWPDVPVVVISVREDMQIIRSALRAGATGYIPKTSTPEVTMNAIRLVLSGGIYVPPDALQLHDPFNNADETPTRLDFVDDLTGSGEKLHGLTRRQVGVIDLVSEGRSNIEIASTLGLTPGTVKMHLSRIYKVLKVKSRTEAIAKFGKLKAANKID